MTWVGPALAASPELAGLKHLDLTNNPNPQPIRGENGGTDTGPRNEAIQRQNPDLLARPGTDMGDIANAKWPMGLSSTRSGLAVQITPIFRGEMGV